MTGKTYRFFGPYGVLNQDEAPNDDHLIPIDWRPADSNPKTTFEQKWEKWFQDVLKQINDVLWPQWDPSTSNWASSASVARMADLTKADFGVFELMAAKCAGRGLDRFPEVLKRPVGVYTHRELFVIEDNRSLADNSPVIPFASYYSGYDPNLAKDLADRVAPLWFDSTHHKIKHMHYRIKVALQRPRPNQTAMMLGFPSFVNEVAVTGLTPSACSGHCLQGLVGMGGVREFFRRSNINLIDKNEAAMRQFAVDIGDRRVMAGVHYPSDNICSWIVLMNMADRVYRDPSIKSWLWEAIRDYSTVYEDLNEFAQTPAGKALQIPLDHLHKLAC